MRLLVAFVLSFLWSLAVYPARVILEVGSTTTVRAPSSGAVRVKNSKFVTVTDRGSSLQLTGRLPGRAIVTTKEDSTEVFVLNSRDFKFWTELNETVSTMRGLSVDQDEEGIKLKGKLLRISDLQAIADLENQNFIFEAAIDPLVTNSFRTMVEHRLAQSSLAFPVLRWEPYPVALVAKEQNKLKELYSAALAPLGVRVQSSESVIELQPLVRVKIAVTEVRKKFMQKLGVSWPTSAKAQLLPNWIAPGKTEGISVQLDALEEQGFGKILASPTILCRSGKNAEFFAGGEFPIKVVGYRSKEITWKKYGIILKVAPVADQSGRMSIALTTEVSTIDQSQTVDGVPGLLTNRIESHFDLARSRTIALSGLLKEESGTSRQGLPGLSSIPILGMLFSSQDYRDQKTELIVFVTPEVVNDEGMQ